MPTSPPANLPTSSQTPTQTPSPTSSLKEIQLNEPQPQQTVQSPLLIRGKAPNTWFFEAQIRAKLVAANGTVLAENALQANDDWTKPGLVSFSGELIFQPTIATNATLIIENDNPSGLPKNQKSEQLPLLLAPVSAPAPTLTPEATALRFYNLYNVCIANPPKAAAGQVNQYCQTHSGLTTADFAVNLAAHAGRGADPILCAQNFPSDFKTGDVNRANFQTTVIVLETFGPSTVQTSVMLKLINNVWLVSDVQCAKR